MEYSLQTGLLESIFLLENEPLDLLALIRISGLAKETVLQGIELLQKEYQSAKHGIELIKIGGGYIFTPKRDLWDILKKRYGKKNEGRLSRAAIETLSIIAYSQPTTKPEIESIRGVSADGMLKLLIERNLIKETGKKDAPGKPIQYSTTREFLKLFRLSSIADLPKLDELDRDRFEANK